jgi:hypothetical protein
MRRNTGFDVACLYVTLSCSETLASSPTPSELVGTLHRELLLWIVNTGPNPSYNMSSVVRANFTSAAIHTKRRADSFNIRAQRSALVSTKEKYSNKIGFRLNDSRIIAAYVCRWWRSNPFDVGHWRGKRWLISRVYRIRGAFQYDICDTDRNEIEIGVDQTDIRVLWKALSCWVVLRRIGGAIA